ncbi:hypothetical protein G7Y29_03645 [Corynebacterium qintianiae]|uniref:Secreted protein n=1 Tax=Corynebacterium qintianiae TaxID=2709392 RepID=A0A7T0KPZ5_9CORY|nr:hypothetical protein [Corynebacterium qintianiae]QPK83898.1 hypothetical protein G7Y29_03645 [Corynebacterium qintianiae]
MNTTTRKSTAAGFFALAALGLVACSPPHQVDSGHKVATATSQDPDSLSGATTTASRANVAEASKAQATTSAAAAGQQPVYVNCGNSLGTEPDRIVLTCQDENDFIENITWDEWTESIATGTGTRVTVDPDRREEETQIILANPQQVNGELQFTNVTVDGIPVNPESQY